MYTDTFYAELCGGNNPIGFQRAGQHKDSWVLWGNVEKIFQYRLLIERLIEKHLGGIKQ